MTIEVAILTSQWILQTNTGKNPLGKENSQMTDTRISSPLRPVQPNDKMQHFSEMYIKLKTFVNLTWTIKTFRRTVKAAFYAQPHYCKVGGLQM